MSVISTPYPGAPGGPPGGEDDGVDEEGEARVALHTRRSLVPAVIARTSELHPYDIPCVIAMSLNAGNPEYLDWIIQETREP